MRIVITGSSTGIGRAITEHLLEAGHQVWGLARTSQRLLAETYANFGWSQCDVGLWEEVDQAASAVGQIWPDADALITCAGVQGVIGPAMAIDPIQWSATVRTNLDGTFYAIRAFHALLRKASRRPKIVCFSGGGATKPRPNFSAYGVAKTGVVRLVETLADEWAAERIDINAVAPGAINTRLTDEVIALGPEKVGEKEYAAAVKQKSTGGASLERVIGLINWLLSIESDGIRGRLLSAPWDPWETLQGHCTTIASSDVYTLRRIVPEDRNLVF